MKENIKYQDPCNVTLRTWNHKNQKEVITSEYTYTHTHIDSATLYKLTILKGIPLSVTKAMFLFWHTTFDTVVKYCFSKSSKNGGLLTLFYCRTLEEVFDKI